MSRLSGVAGSFAGEVRRDEPMALHTTLRVGGPADLFLVPATLEQLRQLLVRIEEERLPFLVIGGGSNLLVRDGGIRGCVISLAGLDRIEHLPDQRVEAWAGVGTAALSRFAEQSSLTGLEFLCGIPGSLGGALAVNAGAHGSEIIDKVERLTTLCEGELRLRSRQELEYGYRFLTLSPGEVVVSALFHLESGDPEQIAKRRVGYLAHRAEVQRVGLPNAGSFFKNPAGQAAWRLIDQAGMRGVSVGGAQVSELHTNFLVNRGGASAADFLELARLIKDRVKAASGVELEEEVRIVGQA